MYVSLGKAAKQLGVTPATVRRWTASGFLPCVRTAGGHRRIATEDIDDIARAIGDRSHLEAQHARERQLETLVRASVDVAGRLDQTELLAEIARHVTRLFGCHTCEILEYDRAGDAVRVLAEYDLAGRRRPTEGVFALGDLPVTRRVLDKKEAIVVNADQRGADPAEVALMRRYGEKSILMLPLVFRDEAIGLLEACDRERARSYSAQELRLGRALAGHAAVALRNAQLFAAAHDADSAARRLRRRLAELTARLSDGPDAAKRGETMNDFAEAVRAAFEAQSCVVVSEGEAAGAAAAPVPEGHVPRPPGRPPCVITAAARTGGVRAEVTLTLPRPAEPGETELLELAAVMAAGAARS